MTSRAAWHERQVQFAAHPIGWPLARLAQRLSPALHVPGLGLVVSDAELAHDILMRDELFTKNGPGSLSATMTALLGPSALGNMDGDSHARLRNRLTDITAPSQAAALLQGCREPLQELEQRLLQGECVDMVEVMRWMSGRITFDMLGVTPRGDVRQASRDLVALGERIARGFDFRAPSAKRLERVRVDCDRLVSLARHGFDAPDAPPSSFVRRLRDLGFSFEEARGVLGLVFLAGTLTTAAALPRIVALLVDSGQLASLRERPSAVASAVAEGLRYTTPVPATMRIAQRDVTIGSVRIKRHTRVIILTTNLARDRAMFSQPHLFLADRVQPPRARNLWYGAGPHFCLGFAIAQRQLHMVIEQLAQLPGSLQIVHRTAARGVIVPAYASLVLSLSDRS